MTNYKWTPDNLKLLSTLKPADAAAHFGLTMQAIYMARKRHGLARPSKAQQIRALSERGFTTQEIANALDTTVSAVYQTKRRNQIQTSSNADPIEVD